jgi:hypothetical protein
VLDLQHKSRRLDPASPRRLLKSTVFDLDSAIPIKLPIFAINVIDRDRLEVDRSRSAATLAQ